MNFDLISAVLSRCRQCLCSFSNIWWRHLVNVDKIVVGLYRVTTSSSVSRSPDTDFSTNLIDTLIPNAYPSQSFSQEFIGNLMKNRVNRDRQTDRQTLVKTKLLSPVFYCHKCVDVGGHDSGCVRHSIVTQCRVVFTRYQSAIIVDPCDTLCRQAYNVPTL